MSALCRVLLLPCHIAFRHHSREKLLLQCKKCAIRQPLNRRLISNHTTACIAIVFVQTVFQEWNFAWRSVSSNVLSETKQDQHCCRIRHQSLLKKNLLFMPSGQQMTKKRAFISIFLPRAVSRNEFTLLTTSSRKNKRKKTTILLH